MASSPEILIGDEGQHVLIRPVSRSHPGLFDFDDGNWIVCELEIVAGGFRGNYRADFRSEEFDGFLEEMSALNKTLVGSATFSTMERQLVLSLDGDGRGLVRVQGEAVDSSAAGNRLQFGFDIDQSSLSEIRRALESLLAIYPVAGSART